MKRILVIRYGAYGDCIMLTPVLKKLKSLGHYVMMNCTERGMEIFENNPYIDEFIFQKSDEVPRDRLHAYWDELKEKYKADEVLNYCESIEVDLACHPRDREKYFKSQEWKLENCNKNYYEHSFDWGKIEYEKEDLKPELFFSKQEAKDIKKILDMKKFNIVWGLIGSGMNKMYPWAIQVINYIQKNIKNCQVYTVGDYRCVHIEKELDKDVFKLSGKIPMRMSLIMTKFCDLVVAPDTGLLHGAGCYNTPKIGLLGHTTIENVTKHFLNDYTIEADRNLVPCSPCFLMIYDYLLQCHIDETTGSSDCMGKGIHPQKVINTIREIYMKSRKSR